MLLQDLKPFRHHFIITVQPDKDITCGHCDRFVEVLRQPLPFMIEEGFAAEIILIDERFDAPQIFRRRRIQNEDKLKVSKSLATER